MRKKAYSQACLSPFGRMILLILCAIPLFPLFSPAAAAEGDCLAVYVSAGGKTVKVASYGEDEFKLIGSERHCYSSLNSEGAPVTIIAEGVTISSLLESLSIPFGDVQTLAFSAGDGWKKSYDADAHFRSGRYYYSGIVSGYDVAASETFESPQFVEGTDSDRQAVPSMLAFASCEGRFEEEPAAEKLTEMGALRFCHGQTSITDAVMLDYGKNINSLTVGIKDGSSYELPDGEEAAPESSMKVPEGGLPEKLDTTGLKADTLTITVGYYGSAYYTKKVFTYDEMAEMAAVRQVYSYIDNMPAVCLTAAVGVPLTRLLDEAGVDVNSVQSFNFYCADVSRTWYTSMTKTQLLDTPRFYYPNLPSRWDYDEMRPLPMATTDAVEVEAILAISDKWRRFATELDFTDMTDTTRYRLVFGQTDVYSLEASKSAKWVHTIAVTLGGTPPKGILTDQSVLEGKVGSTYTISAIVEKGDSTTDTRVTWSSSDENVAKVDKNGKVTITGEGEAVITVTTMIGGLKNEIVIRGTPENEPDKESAAQEAPQGDEARSVPPAETPQPATEISAVILDGDAAEDPPNQTLPEDAPSSDKPLKASAAVYKVVLGGVMPDADESPDGAVQNWRKAQMAKDAAALTEIAVDSNTLWQAAVALSILFFASIAARILKYRLEVDDAEPVE